ncbi:mannitol-1-phosphate 5-dehydrogenase [candidate division KSB1 bacterium]
MNKIVIFGAGNIGRSFIAQLFSKVEYEIVFIDINPVIVDTLNIHRSYRIEIKDINPETILVKNVRAVNSNDSERVIQEIANANLVSTSVGPKLVYHLYEDIANGILLRKKSGNKNPFNIIICENLRNAKEFFYDGIKKHLGEDFPDDWMPGLVETSIGKMVPIMKEEDKKDDPLLVYAEAYNTLILDKNGFKGNLPVVPGLDMKENMKAYVDRKLFIHNLGHSAAAYLGYLTNPNLNYIWEVMEIPEIEKSAKAAMLESGQALIKEYPDEFNEKNQNDHINDLLQRFKNRFLNDTIYRVGRDIHRKLEPEDRLIGSLRMDIKHKINYENTLKLIAAAMLFRAKDENGDLYFRDEQFVNSVYSKGIENVLIAVCRLQSNEDKEIIEDIIYHHKKLNNNPFYYTNS